MKPKKIKCKCGSKDDWHENYCPILIAHRKEVIAGLWKAGEADFQKLAKKQKKRYE